MSLRSPSDQRQLFSWAPIVALAMGFSAVAVAGLIWPSSVPKTQLVVNLQEPGAVQRPGTEEAVPVELAGTSVSILDGTKLDTPVAVTDTHGAGTTSVSAPRHSVDVCVHPGPHTQVIDADVRAIDPKVKTDTPEWLCRTIDAKVKPQLSVTFNVAAKP